MKKFIKGVMIFVGVLIIIGSAGSMEQEMITVTQAIFKMINGGVIAVGGWLFGELAEACSVIKKGRANGTKSHKIIEFRSVA